MSAQPRIDYGRMLDSLNIEGYLLTAATHDVHPDAFVGGVSGRTARETVRDMGDFCDEVLSWIGGSTPTAQYRTVSDHAELPELTRRFTARLADLLAEFGTRPLEQPCPTWWPEDRGLGFWLRRVLHATVLHRIDLQTAGRVEHTPIDSALACDGIDEVLRFWLGYRLRALGINAHHSWLIAVRAAAREWFVAADAGEVQVVSSPEGGTCGNDAVLTGDPAAVYLWLWGRKPDREVNTVGDRDALAQFWGLLRLATR